MKTTYAGASMKRAIPPQRLAARRFKCDHCKGELHWHEMAFLRERCALPQEPTLHVHEACVEAFIAENGPSWRKIPRDSREAGWFVY